MQFYHNLSFMQNLVAGFLLCYCNPQQKPGKELLDKTIAYHDPETIGQS
jgi:hypothetical protein